MADNEIINDLKENIQKCYNMCEGACRDVDKSGLCACIKSVYLNKLEELQKYQEIGTVEEFKCLKEKEEPKKPISKMAYGRKYYYCPICNSSVTIEMEHGCEPDYELGRCENCGQAISWDN